MINVIRFSIKWICRIVSALLMWISFLFVGIGIGFGIIAFFTEQIGDTKEDDNDAW